MQCQKCQSDVAANANFCMQCGHRNVVPVSTDSEPANQRLSRNHHGQQINNTEVHIPAPHSSSKQDGVVLIRPASKTDTPPMNDLSQNEIDEQDLLDQLLGNSAPTQTQAVNSQIQPHHQTPHRQQQPAMSIETKDSVDTIGEFDASDLSKLLQPAAVEPPASRTTPVDGDQPVSHAKPTTHQHASEQPAHSSTSKDPTDLPQPGEPSEQDAVNQQRSTAQQTEKPHHKKQIARDLLRAEIALAKTKLGTEQAPTTNKPPRSLGKIQTRLEAIKSSDIEEIRKQLKAAGATRHAKAVDLIRDFLSHPNVAVRQTCVEQLERIPTPQSAMALLTLLEDQSAAVASKSSLALLNLQHPESTRPVLAYCIFDIAAMPAVRELLEEEGEEEQAIRTRSLAAIINQPVEVPDFQSFALHLFARLQADRGIRIYAKCTKHEVPEVRAAALEALAATDNKRNVMIFNKAMMDSSPEVVAAAANALDKLHSPKSIILLNRSLNSTSAIVRRASAKTLSHRDDSDGSIAAAASKAMQKETDQATMESLLEIVSRGGTQEAIGTLQKLAFGEDQEARYRAILSLRKVKSPKTVQVLLPLLEHADDKTRRLAVDALGRLKAKKSISLIRSMLKDDTSEDVRAACARSLGELADAESLPALEQELQGSGPVQIQSVIALGMIGSQDSIPALLAQLRSPAPEIRVQACNALGLIGGLKNTEPMESLLDDKEAMVRRSAEVNLKKLGVTAKNSKWTRAAKRQLSRVGGAMVPNSLLSLAPGGNSGIVVFGAVAVIAVVGYLATQLSGVISSPGSHLPVTRIASVSINSTGNTAYASRSNGVIDVWDLQQGILQDRFKPKGKYNVLSDLTGKSALLYSNTKAFVFDQEAGFDASAESKLIDIPGVNCTYQPTDSNKIWIASNQSSGCQLSLVDRNQFRVEKKVTIADAIDGVFAINNEQTLVAVPMVKGLKLYIGKDLKPAPRLLEMSQLAGNASIGAVKAATFNESGQLLALACEKGVIVLELPSGELVKVLFKDQLSNAEKLVCVQFQESTNQLIAYTNRGGSLTTDETFGKTTRQAAADNSMMDHYSIAADGSTMIYAPPTSKDLIVSQLSTGRVLHKLKGKQ